MCNTYMGFKDIPTWHFKPSGKLLILWIFCLLLVIGGIVTFGNRGLLKLYQVKTEMDSILQLNAQLAKENENLIREIQRLKCDKYVEEIARRDLGLIKDGELIYQFEQNVKKHWAR